MLVAYCGSLLTGAASAVWPPLCLASPEVAGLFTLIGAGIGFFWGHLAVIVAAGSSATSRSRNTMWMQALLAGWIMPLSALLAGAIADF